MSDISISKLIHEIDQGEIRVPAFQRGFVWDEDHIAYLLDSIYKGYPVGSLILWKTKETLARERDLGPFKIPDSADDYPVKYVLDGQQRITSIYGTFKDSHDAQESGAEWPQIYFDLQAEEDPQASRFIIFQEKADPNRYFPVNTFFSTIAYRKATRELSDEIAERVDEVQQRFKDAKIAIQEISTDSRGEVAIVFERVNRLGVELDALQLLSAWTWSEEFDLLERFQELSANLEGFGFGGIGDDSQLLLRCFSALIKGNSDPESLIELESAIVRDKFEEVENGLKGAIDFLKANLGITDLKQLPSDAVLVPLCVFFAAENGRQVAVTDRQRAQIVRWLWRSFFGKRFSAGTRRNLNQDIKKMEQLKKSDSTELAEFTVKIDASHFQTRKLNVGSVEGKTFILLLVNSSPLSFISGQPISEEKKAAAFNRSELHHLMPAKYLKEQLGMTRGDASVLANFALISSVDNKKLGGSAPSVYKKSMPTNSLDKILSGALADDTLFQDDYEPFLEARATLLAERAQQLMQ